MNQQSKIAVLFFALLGAVLRVYNIGFQCLWLEEIYTLNIAKLPGKDIIATSIATDYNPPTFYLITHISLLAAGASSVAIRYPAAVFGILLIPAMYLLGKEYKDELTGVFCSGTTAILFPLVYYSQYGRAYTLSLLCFVVALIFYIRVWRSPSHLNEHIFWILIGVNAWIHLFSLIPLGFLALSLLVQKTRARMPYALLPLAICLPLGTMFLDVAKNRAIESGINYGYDPLMMTLLTPGEFYGVLFVMVFSLIFVWMWSQLRKDRLCSSLSIVAILTVSTGIALSVATPFFPRYYLTVSLIGILFAGSAVSEILLHWLPQMYFYNNAHLIVVAIVILFFALQYGDFLNYYTVQKYLCP